MYIAIKGIESNYIPSVMCFMDTEYYLSNLNSCLIQSGIDIIGTVL